MKVGYMAPSGPCLQPSWLLWVGRPLRPEPMNSRPQHRKRISRRRQRRLPPAPCPDTTWPLHKAGLEDDLARVRAATARFHDLDAALEAGYELGWVNGSGIRIITGCVAHPTAGAMGYHYFKKELMDDLAVDALQPEALVYAPGEDGKLKLAAVEWVVRGPNSNPPGIIPPPIPTVLGMEMHILVPPPGPAFYLMHAWVWQPNPAGMFADWNPEVTCP